MRGSNQPYEKGRRILQILRNLESGDAGTRVFIEKERQRLSAAFERRLDIRQQYDRLMKQLEKDEELKSDVMWLCDNQLPELEKIKISDCVVEGDFLKAVAKSHKVSVSK